MPLYEFECSGCNQQVEIIGSANMSNRVECPICRKVMNKKLSAANIIIAGNSGPKLRTRPALAKELRKQGFGSPLYKSRENEDKAEWMLNKVGVR